MREVGCGEFTGIPGKALREKYSNKMRGQRAKHTSEEDQTAVGNAVAVIDVSEYKPRRIPSAKWRELIKKVWEADPLLCPRCSPEMRIVARRPIPGLRHRTRLP